MYKVLRIDGGFGIFWVEEGDPEIPPRPVDGRVKPYSKKQAAYRRCKKLNDAVKHVDEMIKRDGAIIL